MRFYFPDSQDLVSPTYDFLHDEYSPFRIRQRDDRYAHEVLDTPPYDGVLVSKAVVDGSVKGAGKYSEPQRMRLLRHGVRGFFRLEGDIRTMGDCGAFNYATEPQPPYSVREVVDFYEDCGFDEGISVDHLIFGYEPGAADDDVNPDWIARKQLTIRLAEEFLDEVDSRGNPFEPIGVAHGWSPASYAASVEALQQIGYTRIALGGMVPLKTAHILDVLREVRPLLQGGVQLHLLGIARPEAMSAFASLGVTSFDSTASMRQAFMDDRNNYHAPDRSYAAVRIPQVDGNPKLKRAILAGDVSQRDALRMEREALRAVRAYGAREASLSEALGAVLEYEELVAGGRKDYTEMYRVTLGDRPWEACDCALCRDLGVEIVVFRGTERNKRRGFHNLHVLRRKMHLLNDRVSSSREDGA